MLELSEWRHVSKWFLYRDQAADLNTIIRQPRALPVCNSSTPSPVKSASRNVGFSTEFELSHIPGRPFLRYWPVRFRCWSIGLTKEFARTYIYVPPLCN